MEIILLIVILGIVAIFVKNKNNIIEKISNEDLVQIEDFLKEIEVAKTDYFTHSKLDYLKDKYKSIYYNLKLKNHNKLKNDKINDFFEIYSNLDNLVKKWNYEYVDNELLKNQELLSNIDGKSLDEQQRRAVIVDEDNNLILAGAGSGKTLTISAKVKYLVEVKTILPAEILLISFTAKAAEEMNDRISKKLSLNLESKTFHKLGLDIIKNKRKKKPDILDNLSDVVDHYFKNVLYNDKASINKIIDFYGCYVNIPYDLEKFSTLGEYHKYCKSLELTTLKDKCEIQNKNRIDIKNLKSKRKTIKNEQVKSIEEVIIANYLYINGVRYIYEYKYPYDIKDNYRKNYRPDFYLPDYDIYIEHFGINRNNKVPWLTKIQEQNYLEGIKWKRKLHKENNTLLVETYSYYNTEGILLKELHRKLAELGVEFKKRDCVEIYKTIINNKEDRYFKEFRNLIVTFIGLFKSSGFKIDEFDRMISKAKTIKNEFERDRSILFLEIIRPIYEIYQETLIKEDAIDFNDMIIEATDIVKSEEIDLKYKYIIIDEYQDISKSRFELIKAIKEKTNAKLMCVGDDWQSIYRFTGSDIALFTDFEKYVGYSELLKIEKTYRNSQQLIDIAGSFIMKNEQQLKKDLKSDKESTTPIKVVKYKNDISKAVLFAINNIVKDGKGNNVAILGRNNTDIYILEGELFDIKRNGQDVRIICKKYPNLEIIYLTAHRSKGLENDNVIIINLRNKINGFPNQITDDKILDFVLTKSESFDFAEERRLFYVAITRTKNSTYLITPKNEASVFCDELISDYNIFVYSDTQENKDKEIKCPKCSQGNLIERENAKGDKFLGCSNYPMCDFTTNNIEILENPIICELCGGYLVEKKHKDRTFLGCINYPICKNTKSLRH